MKKNYEKPVVDVMEFNLQENIMTSGGIENGFDISQGVEEW